jgi:protein gp37
MNKTSIEWTHRPETGGESGGYTWNPIHAHSERLDHRGKLKTGNFCTKLSPGCANCYAAQLNIVRGNGLDYTYPNLEKAKFYLDYNELIAPLRHKNPATIFVGDMFDFFHEAIPREFQVKVMAVAALCGHRMMFLTKRAAIAREFFQWLAQSIMPLEDAAREIGYTFKFQDFSLLPWPLPKISLGVSIESQKYADERIPDLEETPVAERFLSIEPQLEHVDIRQYLARRRIHLVIDGGESGHNARPFVLAWAESLLWQCRDAGVPFFMKQIGRKPQSKDLLYLFKATPLKDAKGGDPMEWPESLRVRQFPTVRKAPEHGNI